METTDVNIYLLEIACNNGWILQPDLNKRQKLMENMAKKARNNTVLCPCKAFVEGFVDVADVKCPCAEAQNNINTVGKCHCNMFLRKDELD